MAEPTDVTCSDEQPANPWNDYNDDALAEMAVGFADEADGLFRKARAAKAELHRRLVDRDAKVLDTPNWKGKMQPGKITHVIENPDRLRQRLVPHVDTQDLIPAFVEPKAPPLRCDHRFLNDHHKRGGLIAQIIDEERASIRADDVLVLERKPTIDEERARQEKP